MLLTRFKYLENYVNERYTREIMQEKTQENLKMSPETGSW